jgi:serine/threonine protein kinase
MESELPAFPRDNYDLKKQIGEGAYGRVYLAGRKSDDAEVAVKVVNISRMDRLLIHHTLNEVRILGSLSCEYVVEYQEAFLDQNETHLWMVMEFMGGGDLARAIDVIRRQQRSFPEVVIWQYFIQILKGLSHLSKHHIVHRDIKPPNLFLTGDLSVIKLGDMNISKVLKEDLATTQIGSPSYLAPEIWEGRPYDASCDIWSLGCCMYEMTTLRLPFEAPTMSELKQRVRGVPVPPIEESYSSDLKSLILKCLTKAPAGRPTADNLLGHPALVSRACDLGLTDVQEIGSGLLDTICLPRDLKTLNQKLPRGKDRSLSRKMSEKSCQDGKHLSQNSDLSSNRASLDNTHSKVNTSTNNSNNNSQAIRNLNTPWRNSDTGERRSNGVVNGPQLPITKNQAPGKKVITPIFQGNNQMEPNTQMVFQTNPGERKSTPVVAVSGMNSGVKVLQPRTPPLSKSPGSKPLLLPQRKPSIPLQTPIKRTSSNSHLSPKPEVSPFDSRKQSLRSILRQPSKGLISAEETGQDREKTSEMKLASRSDNSENGKSFQKPPLNAKIAPPKPLSKGTLSPSPKPPPPKLEPAPSQAKFPNLPPHKPNGSQRLFNLKSDKALPGLKNSSNTPALVSNRTLAKALSSKDKISPVSRK